MQKESKAELRARIDYLENECERLQKLLSQERHNQYMKDLGIAIALVHKELDNAIPNLYSELRFDHVDDSGYYFVYKCSQVPDKTSSIRITHNEVRNSKLQDISKLTEEYVAIGDVAKTTQYLSTLAQNNQILILPFPPQEYVYRVVRASSKYKKKVYKLIKVSYRALVLAVYCNNEVDMYFPDEESANKKIEELTNNDKSTTP